MVSASYIYEGEKSTLIQRIKHQLREQLGQCRHRAREFFVNVHYGRMQHYSIGFIATNTQE
jgi:hypothetical protein